MARAYDQKLVTKLQNQQQIIELNEIDVIVKPIPDCPIPGAVDPRHYKYLKAQRNLDFTNLELGAQRKLFTTRESSPLVEDSSLIIKKTTFPAADGIHIPMTSYQTKQQLKNAPVLYYIHGGGFFGGHSTVVEDAVKFLVAQTNILAFSVDYRLTPEHLFPIGHEDCYTGLQWVHQHAQAYGGDADNIFIAGDSAGGHLALYCANKAIADNLTYITGQIILYPPVNFGLVDDPYIHFDRNAFEIYAKHETLVLPAIYAFQKSAQSLPALLGVTDVRNVYVTPYLSVSSKLPPTLICAGEHDFLKLDTLAYARKLIKAGVDTTTILYRGIGHGYISRIGYQPQAEDFVLEMGSFILSHSRALAPLNKTSA